MTDQKRERIEAELAFVEDLNELWDTYKETYPDIVLELATANLNFGIRSILFQTDPMVMAETVTSSLNAWLSFSRNLTEQEDEEEPEYRMERVQVISKDGEVPDPELLFMDVTDEKPN